MDNEFAEKLIGIALKKGADEAEVYMKSVKNLGIEVKDMAIDTLESSVTQGYCIRVIKDTRLGFSYSNDQSEFEMVAEKAIETSKYTEPDEYLGLPSFYPVPTDNTAIEIYDRNIALLSENDAINNTMLIEDAARKEDPRVRKVRKAAGNFSTSQTYILNSHGVKAHYSSTACAAHILTVAEDNNESQMGWDYSGGRFLNEISFEQVGRNAAKRAVQLLGARKISPVRGFVILDNSVTSDFLGILSSALSSESVQKKKSMLAGKKGELVLSHKLNIKDSGLINKKLGSKPVDDEGVPVTEKILIENGVLQGYLYNTYTAKKEGLKSTGNAVRGGPSGLPSVGITNLYIEPSSHKYKMAFKDLFNIIDKGIYVIETMGMHTANPISGEFSVGISGLWIENGEVQYPVKEAVISGNILDLFKNTAMVGDDLRFYGNIGTPSLLIEKIDISG